MTQRSRPDPDLEKAAAAEPKETAFGELPELLAGETENQSAAAMDRLSSRLRHERRAARVRMLALLAAALAALAWAAWRVFRN